MLKICIACDTIRTKILKLYYKINKTLLFWKYSYMFKVEIIISYVKLEQVLEDNFELSIVLVTFKFLDFNGEGVVMANRYGIVVNKDHLWFALGYFFEVL